MNNLFFLLENVVCENIKPRVFIDECRGFFPREEKFLMNTFDIPLVHRADGKSSPKKFR